MNGDFAEDLSADREFYRRAQVERTWDGPGTHSIKVTHSTVQQQRVFWTNIVMR